MTRQRESVMLGAAGNVARNVAALGAKVALVGVVGQDAAVNVVTRAIRRSRAAVGVPTSRSSI